MTRCLESMDHLIDLAEEFEEGSPCLERLQRQVLTALLDPSLIVREVHQEYVADVRICFDCCEGKQVLSDVHTKKAKGKAYLEVSRVRSAFIGDNQVFLRLEDTRGLRYLAYLCDLPKPYIGTALPEYSKSFCTEY